MVERVATKGVTFSKKLLKKFRSELHADLDEMCETDLFVLLYIEGHLPREKKRKETVCAV